MKISKKLFELTADQEATSKMMYDGKTIKCLVAPYHTYAALEKVIPYSPNTFLFPEREVTATQLRSFISMIVADKKHSEYMIITANQSIIMDMVDDCVRILTEGGNIVPCPVKTFMANIHDIRYSLLENEIHQTSKEEKSKSNEKINMLISRLDSSKKITQSEYNELEKQIGMIGEELIVGVLTDKLHSLDVV